MTARTALTSDPIICAPYPEPRLLFTSLLPQFCLGSLHSSVVLVSLKCVPLGQKDN